MAAMHRPEPPNQQPLFDAFCDNAAPPLVRALGLRTRGPQVSPTAVSCTRQVQSSTVVVARSTHCLMTRERATAATDGNLSLSALSPIAAAALHAPIDTGVTSRDVRIDPATGVAARIYLPSFRSTTKVPVLVYFHGGAFVVESAFNPIYHAYLNTLAAKAGVVAVSVNYRLAPENPLPAAYDDSWAALRWVLANAAPGADQWLSQYGDLSRLFLAGDSAGGNIAHNLALRAGEEGLDGGARIRGVALLDPYFQGRSAVGAQAMDPAYLQSAAKTWSFICDGKYPIDHPYANPLTLPAASWQHLGCSRVLVTVSGQDRLSPWQRAYYSTLRSSGWPGQAELYETPGEGHVYFLTKLSTPQAQAEMATLVAFINRDD